MSIPLAPPPPARASIAVYTLIIFAFLLVGLGWGIGSGFTLLLHQLPLFSPPIAVSVNPPADPANAKALPPELELRYQLLKNQLDNAAETSRQLDRLVTLLLTLTSLYALALGLNSYFGLKQILESGKDDLAKLRDFLLESRTSVTNKLTEVDTKVDGVVATANTQLTDFRGELREKYPELANLHSNVRDLLVEIRLMFPTGRDWTKQYGGLTTEQRERFNMAEMRIVSLEVFGLWDVDPLRQDARQVYQGLGRFYSSQYSIDKQRPAWERASLYFENARRLPIKPMSELLKDLGVHLTLVEQLIDARIAAAGAAATAEETREVDVLRTRAERVFRESLAENPLEPGSLFGLAWVYYKQAKYRDAIAQYTLLTTITTWAPGDKQKFLEDAYFNQACCYSLDAPAAATDPAYTSALDCLKESKKAAVEFNHLVDWKTKIEKEAASGDLRKLRTANDQGVTEVIR